MRMHIKTLLHDYVAIKVDKPVEVTASGLHIAKQIKTYPQTGTVTEVAIGVSGIQRGDRVQYKVYASVDLDEDTAIIPASGIIAILS